MDTNKCKTCEHALFNELWGDYKCAVSGLYIYKDEDCQDCTDYKKGTPGIAKGECHE